MFLCNVVVVRDNLALFGLLVSYLICNKQEFYIIILLHFPLIYVIGYPKEMCNMFVLVSAIHICSNESLWYFAQTRNKKEGGKKKKR